MSGTVRHKINEVFGLVCVVEDQQAPVVGLPAPEGVGYRRDCPIDSSGLRRLQAKSSG